MLIIAFLGRLWRLHLILLIRRKLLKRVHRVLDLLQMVSVDADCLKGCLFSAVRGDKRNGAEILILSRKLYICSSVYSERSKVLSVILGEENGLVGVVHLLCVNSGRGNSLGRLWLRILHVLDLDGIFIAR